MPEYMKNHIVYYAGPAKTPENQACGSLGPTTGGRMDGYVDAFQAAGGSLIMLSKGNRSQQVTDACHKHGGFNLGSIGGAAALLAQQFVKPALPGVSRTGHGGGVDDGGRKSARLCAG
jgi:fumarate hydratase class I